MHSKLKKRSLFGILIFTALLLLGGCGGSSVEI